MYFKEANFCRSEKKSSLRKGENFLRDFSDDKPFQLKRKSLAEVVVVVINFRIQLLMAFSDIIYRHRVPTYLVSTLRNERTKIADF